MTGQHVGSYQILEKLGEGGMGVVYKARDSRLNRMVAIKFLPANIAADAVRKQRFIHEARAASALNHPNIIVIHDIGVDGGRDYLVMEYVDGKTLDALIPRAGMKTREALKAAAQVAAGLSRAHEAGIIHRDLKPSNIMVSKDGLVKVLDFGLAKLTEIAEPAPSDATKTSLPVSEEGTIAGTVAYMSPEQAEGRKLDPRSDVFAFGSVLYEMLSGRRAFDGESRISTLAAVLNRDPQPLEGVPAELDRLVRRCLRKEPERRWQTMADLRIALEELADESFSGAAIPASPRPPNRKRAWLVAAGVVLAAVAGLAALAKWRTLSAPNPAGPVLTRLTDDDGVAVTPAISPDGKLVAFASDRSGEGNLDIWVMQTSGGQPIRITQDKANDTSPSFSPDSSKIIFRSERDQGGIYVIAALGGDAKLLVPLGREPKFSPDGKWVAYVYGDNGGNLNKRQVYVIPVAGGTPKEVSGNLHGVDEVVWSPDSENLLVWALDVAGKVAVRDLWLLGVEKSAVTPLLLRERVQGGLPSQNAFPKMWLGDFIYFGAGRDLWRIEARRNQLVGNPERITAGTSSLVLSSVAYDGGKPVLALAARELDTSIWFSQGDTVRGKTVGEPRKLTHSLADEYSSTVSGDGTKMAFARRGRVWIQDLASGKEMEGPETGYPVIKLNFDGSRLAYPARPTGGALSMVSPPLQSPVVLRNRNSTVTDFSRDGKYAIIRETVSSTDPTTLRLSILEIASGKESVLTQNQKWILSAGKISPDEQWFALHAQNSLTTRQLFVAPFRTSSTVNQSEWIPVTDGTHLDRNPAWSPDGKLIYFLSERDGFRCVWAMPYDAAAKKPGEPFPVFHAHSPRLSLSFTNDTSLVGLNVTKDGLIFAMQELRSNVWLARLP